MRKTKKRVVRKECLHVAQKRFVKIQRQFWSYEKSCNMKTWASIQHLWCQVLFDQHWACPFVHQKLIRCSSYVDQIFKYYIFMKQINYSMVSDSQILSDPLLNLMSKGAVLMTKVSRTFSSYCERKNLYK